MKPEICHEMILPLESVHKSATIEALESADEIVVLPLFIVQLVGLTNAWDTLFPNGFFMVMDSVTRPVDGGGGLIVNVWPPYVYVDCPIAMLTDIRNGAIAEKNRRMPEHEPVI